MRHPSPAAFLLLGAFTGMIACAHLRDEPPPSNVAGFAAEIEALQAFFHIPGLAILVKGGDAIVYEHQLGYADLENRVPVNAVTVFPIASITKSIATVLLLQLVEDGALSLDDPVSDYYDGFDAAQDTQIKHIFSHTSEGTPGEAFLYSRRFGLGRRIIEQASGQDYAILMQSRIFDRAGMTDTIAMIEIVNAANCDANWYTEIVAEFLSQQE